MASRLAKEKDPACQQLISEHVLWCKKTTGFHHHRQPCIHPDQLAGFPDGTFAWQGGESFLQRARIVDKSCLKATCQCLTHPGDECSLWGPTVDICTAGIPCTDQSRAGPGLYEEGATSDVFISHAKYNIERRTKVIILENVSDCGGQKLSEGP